MPQITLELSSNIIEKDLKNLLLKIHLILADELPTLLESCKSRVIYHENFLIGNGDINNAFIHLTIEVLQGRSKKTLESIANKILVLLSENFQEYSSKFNLKISVSLKNLPEIYLRNS